MTKRLVISGLLSMLLLAGVMFGDSQPIADVSLVPEDPHTPCSIIVRFPEKEDSSRSAIVTVLYHAKFEGTAITGMDIIRHFVDVIPVLPGGDVMTTSMPVSCDKVWKVEIKTVQLVSSTEKEFHKLRE